MTTTPTIRSPPPPTTTAKATPTVQTTSPLPYDPFRKGGISTNNSGRKKAGTKDADSKGIWVSMLDAVSRGKDLAEKQLIILGGTPEQQREFLCNLVDNPSEPSTHPHTQLRRRRNNRAAGEPPTGSTSMRISNRFALGYTYQDVLDTDQEDILARVSIYMLCNPSAAFRPLLKPLFTSETVPNTLITILLDWEDPFQWPRQLRQWIRLIRGVVESLDEDVRGLMEETMKGWRERRVGAGVEGLAGLARPGEVKTHVVPLGPGEWDDGLGVPLSVVCLNAEKEEKMEKEYGWQERDFDFVLQWMRCVLLKHGGSLIYTTAFDSNNVRTLIHSTLGIQSLLKRETVKHNVIGRDKILIPPNWDSWGKIRILREGFEMEAVANAWSVEIQSPPEADFESSAAGSFINDNGTPGPESGTNKSVEESSISIFVSSLPNPTASSKPYIPSTGSNDVVTVPDTQTFLAEQAQVLEQLRQEDERRARKVAPPHAPGGSLTPNDGDDAAGRARITEQSGPYNINVGGIQIDAEEVTRRIREREADRDRDRDRDRDSNRAPGKEVGATGPGSGLATSDNGKMQNEMLASYFAGLMKKAKGSNETPRSGS